jgi:Putative addiction module component
VERTVRVDPAPPPLFSPGNAEPQLGANLNLWTAAGIPNPSTPMGPEGFHIQLLEKIYPLDLSEKSTSLQAMTQVAALLKEASKLDLQDRAELVSSLLEDLDPEPHCVSDEEVSERLEEIRSGKVKGLTKEEFWKACGRP